MPSVRYANGPDLGAWDGRNRSRTKAAFNSKKRYNYSNDGSTGGPFPATSSTPTTHPDPRSIDSHTNRMECKRGRCLVYFIIRYRLPAHWPAWGMPLIYLANQFFLTLVSPSPLSPFVPRFPPPPLSRGRHRPSLRCTPSRTCSRYVVRSHSEAGGSKRPSWLVGGRIIEPAVSFGTPNHWKGLRRPFLVQTSESQAVSWNIDFYAETKMNITSGPTMTRPFLVLSRQQKFEWHRQSINIFFVALLAAMN